MKPIKRAALAQKARRQAVKKMAKTDLISVVPRQAPVAAVSKGRAVNIKARALTHHRQTYPAAATTMLWLGRFEKRQKTSQTPCCERSCGKNTVNTKVNEQQDDSFHTSIYQHHAAVASLAL